MDGTVTDATRTIHAIIRTQAPLDATIHPEAELMSIEGLGFDSIGVVQLLLACEERLGVRLPGNLLTAAPLTVGRLVEAVELSLAERT